MNSVCSFFNFSWQSICKSSKLFWYSVLLEVSCFFHFSYIKSLYCNISPVSGSINALMRYQGKGLYQICVAMLCVAIGIVGAIWLIFSCVTISTLIGATLVGLPGSHFTCVSIGISLGSNLGGLPGFIFCVLHPWIWCLVLLLSCGVYMRYWCAHLVWFDFHLTSPSIMSFCWFLIH